ncbi:MAG: hypothetical protein ACTSYI_15555 [Promethearchaeota archaeon]
MSRTDFDGTYPETPSGADLVAPQAVLDAKVALTYPIITGDEPAQGVDNDILLKDLKGKAYDDPLWGDFLDQFTVKELAKQFATGEWRSFGVKRTYLFEEE